jgi:hypothetical protein
MKSVKVQFALITAPVIGLQGNETFDDRTICKMKLGSSFVTAGIG